MEIYNDVAYDLLDPHREVSGLEDLPQVIIMEDDDARVHLRNLGVHRVASEEEALNLVSVGIRDVRDRVWMAGGCFVVHSCVGWPKVDAAHHMILAPLSPPWPLLTRASALPF